MPSSNRSRSSRPSSRSNSSSTYHSPSKPAETPPKPTPTPTQTQQPSRTGDFISNTLATAGGVFLGSALMRSIFGGSSEPNNQPVKRSEPSVNQQSNIETENQYQISSKCRDLFKAYSNCMMQKREQGFDLNDTSLCSEELKHLNNCQNN